jgi:hypothetical protein
MNLCGCGCGGEAGVYPRTHSRLGIVKGAPRKYLPNHNRNGRVTDHGFAVEDRRYKTPCHLWLGSFNQHGYGLMKVGRSSRAAHKVYWEREHGPVPDGLELDHLCKVRGCVRLDHLEPVTHTENVRRSDLAKVTATEVQEIQAAAALGLNKSELARRFGVSRVTITAVLSGTHWTDPARAGTVTPKAYEFTIAT